MSKLKIDILQGTLRSDRKISSNGGRSWATIIGIVSDVRHDGLDRAPADAAYVS